MLIVISHEEKRIGKALILVIQSLNIIVNNCNNNVDQPYYICDQNIDYMRLLVRHLYQ